MPLSRNYLFFMNHTVLVLLCTRENLPTTRMWSALSSMLPLLPTTAQWQAGSKLLESSGRLYPCSEWTCVSVGFISSEAPSLSVYTCPPGSSIRRERRGRKKKKSSPCTHSSVLISILSSPLLPPPLVTTGVCVADISGSPGTKKPPTHLVAPSSHWSGKGEYLLSFFFTFCHPNTDRALLPLTKNLSEAARRRAHKRRQYYSNKFFWPI